MNYILYGEQYPMIKKQLNKLLKEHLGEPDEFNVVKLDFEESSLEEIDYESSSLPLGYEKKAVIVDNSVFLLKDGKKDDCDRIVEILKNSTDEIAIIFILRSEKLNKKSDICKIIEKEGHIFEFLDIDKNDWPIYTTTHNTPPALYGENAQVRNSFVANGSVIKGTVINSVISRDVVVEEGATIEDSIILARTVVKKGAVLRHVVVDKYSKISGEIIGTKENPIYLKQGSKK